MCFFPEEPVFGIELRAWCIYSSIMEMIIFVIPSVYHIIVWDEQQEDNRIIFGVILLIVLTLSVFLLMGAYFKDPLFILIWIIGTVFAQFVVNIYYAFLFLIVMSTRKPWNYSAFETTFTLIQTVVGIFIMWIAIGYYRQLEKFYHDRRLVRMRDITRMQDDTADAPQSSQLAKKRKTEQDKSVKWKTEEPSITEGKKTNSK